MRTGRSVCANSSAWARTFCMMGLTLRKNSSSPSGSISSLTISASALLFEESKYLLIRNSSCPSLKGRTRTSWAPKRLASVLALASSAWQSTITGRLGQRRRSHGKSCRLSVSPRARSSNSRFGATPDCTRSMASQPFAAVSSCQESDSAMDESRRRTPGSLLTASKRSVSVLFSFKGRGSLSRKRAGRRRCGTTSDRFDFVSFYSNCERSLDRFHGNHQGAVSVAGDENALHAIKCATADSYSLPDLEEGM